MKITPIAIALGLASGAVLAQVRAGDAARGKAASRANPGKRRQ